ncbi:MULTISPECIES: hypothetical protein [Streptomyces]|uniref:Uncharacterized protein n=1 Tax=Streptomyces bugieae TaxID=3098223 RepID=A0ABU7NY96_9ACTN|nr:hypothetical protein [Streptomyces nigrescens]MEE4423345.1 hypothetical protein [Streptomyces sp. DSM 41528]
MIAPPSGTDQETPQGCGQAALQHHLEAYHALLRELTEQEQPA